MDGKQSDDDPGESGSDASSITTEYDSVIPRRTVIGDLEEGRENSDFTAGMTSDADEMALVE